MSSFLLLNLEEDLTWNLNQTQGDIGKYHNTIFTNKTWDRSAETQPQVAGSRIHADASFLPSKLRQLGMA